MARREADSRNEGLDNGMPEVCREFEELLSLVVEAFNRATGEQFATVMEENLGRIARFLRFDRSTVLLFDGDRLTVSYNWAGEGGASAPIGRCVENDLPWYAGRMRSGNLLLLLRSVEDLPCAAAKEREYLLQSGVKSHLSIPLIARGASLGAVAFGSLRVRNHWGPGLVFRLRLIGEILTLALERHAGSSMTKVERVPAPIVLKTDDEHLRRLALHLMEVAYRERKRTAERLHEDIMQTLAVAGFMLDAAEAKGAIDDCSALVNAKKQVQRAIRDLRALVMSLQPMALQDFGLGAALGWLARQMHEIHGMEVVLDASRVPGELCPESRIVLYDVARELLSNAAVHGRAKKVTIEVDRTSRSGCRMTVVDNGVGFDTGRLEDIPSASFGLFEIREKARLLGGAFRIASAPGSGTRATVSLPRCRSTSDSSDV